MKERRGSIEDRVRREGEIAFVALAEEFGVSEMTIRRDVEMLETAGVVRRVTGGAIALTGKSEEPAYEQRAGRANEGKEHIATAVVDLLRPHETVILDSGSTVLAVARAIRGRGLGLTIITPSLMAALELSDEPDTTVLLTGGLLRPGELSLIGDDAQTTFDRYNADVFIMGVAGVDAQRGVSDYHREEAAVKTAAARAADRVVVVADQAKIGRLHLVNIVPIDAITTLVTDAPETHSTLSALRTANVEVVCIPAPRPSEAALHPSGRNPS